MVQAVEAHVANLKVPITVAVMGCVVNGPAEARHADIGVTGGRGKGVIFRKGKLYKTVPQDELLTRPAGGDRCDRGRDGSGGSIHRLSVSGQPDP